ncbi:MAG: hypothetical protein MJ250_00150 [Alphaproteobacteria bacterium]|nr:hypothetical protein [Alphaproteobacteria bacterium]
MRKLFLMLLIFALSGCFSVYEMETYKSSDTYQDVFRGTYSPKDVN